MKCVLRQNVRKPIAIDNQIHIVCWERERHFVNEPWMAYWKDKHFCIDSLSVEIKWEDVQSWQVERKWFISTWIEKWRVLFDSTCFFLSLDVHEICKSLRYYNFYSSERSEANICQLSILKVDSLLLSMLKDHFVIRFIEIIQTVTRVSIYWFDKNWIANVVSLCPEPDEEV